MKKPIGNERIIKAARGRRHGGHTSDESVTDTQHTVTPSLVRNGIECAATAHEGNERVQREELKHARPCIVVQTKVAEVTGLCAKAAASGMRFEGNEGEGRISSRCSSRSADSTCRSGRL